MKRLALIGSTGSIGRSTLEVVRRLGKDEVTVISLAAHSNIDLLEQQAKEFSPLMIAVHDEGQARILQQRLPRMEVVAGVEGVKAAASHSCVDLVVSAAVGTAGLLPTVAALQAGKDVALANKETLVAAGGYVTALAKENGCAIIPVDSEHSALFQCLKGESIGEVSRLVLTASGGPFRAYSAAQLEAVTIEQALNHPTWSMGKKVTVDSSTLMNKGLEVIEAHWLFSIPVGKIDVVIHPQSIIHSLVEFVDGSLIAQMGMPSMELPIQYAITHPCRLPGGQEPFDFKKAASLEFIAPDRERFRCLQLAYDALEEGGSMPCYMNAVNEVLVERFLCKDISWCDIGRKLCDLMHAHQKSAVFSLEDILAVDAAGKREARCC